MLALRLAIRDMRGGLRHVRAAMVGLAVGVAAIAAVGSLHRALEVGLAEGGQAILGGDVAFRMALAPLGNAERAALEAAGDISEVVELYGMAAGAGDAVLAAVKAVDGAYPLYGAVALDPAMAIADALAIQDGVPGVVLAPGLAERLGVAPGDHIQLGGAAMAVRALLRDEPDRASSPFLLGERLLIGVPGLDAAGLRQPGSLVRYAYRLRLPDGADAGAVGRSMRGAFPDAGWQVATADAANPQLARFFDRLGTFLTLAGLAALLIGGIGVGSATTAYMARKTVTIAILKAQGGTTGLAFRILLLEVAGLATVGVVAGLAIGAALPFVVAWVVAGVLPVPLRPGLFPAPLATATLFGMLTALAFALWPLLAARRVPAATLLRDGAIGVGRRASPGDRAAVALVPLALAAVAVATSDNREAAAWFVGGAAATFGVFRLASQGIAALARRLAHRLGPGLRLAFAGIGRPGATTTAVLLALGLGLTLMVMIVELDASLRGELVEAMPREAPSFFFLDLQDAQRESFARLVAAAPEGRIIDSVPALRGRITAINGTPVDRATIAGDARWAVQGDRGVTFADAPPPGSTIVAGAWWPADYQGPPLLSLDEGIAQGFGIGIGDRMTINVLGREIEATVASLRRIDWETLGMNFTLVLTPVTLAGAPHTTIATVAVAQGGEVGLRRAVAAALPNVSAVGVREVLDRVVGVLGQIGLAFRIVAGVTLLVGVVVLAEATAAAQRRKLYDAMILKTLGATRRQVMGIYVLEHALLGAITGTLAAVLGSLAAWALASQVMELAWVLPAWPVALTVAGGLVVATAFGFFASFEALGTPVWPLLRAP